MTQKQIRADVALALLIIVACVFANETLWSVVGSMAVTFITIGRWVGPGTARPNGGFAPKLVLGFIASAWLFGGLTGSMLYVSTTLEASPVQVLSYGLAAVSFLGSTWGLSHFVNRMWVPANP